VSKREVKRVDAAGPDADRAGPRGRKARAINPPIGDFLLQWPGKREAICAKRKPSGQTELAPIARYSRRAYSLGLVKEIVDRPIETSVDRTKARWVAGVYREFGKAKTTVPALYYFALGRKAADYPI
jgi:hypothetical protein